MLMPSAKTPWLACAGAALSANTASVLRVTIHLVIATASLRWVPWGGPAGRRIMPSDQLASSPPRGRRSARHDKLGRVEGLLPPRPRNSPPASGSCRPPCDNLFGGAQRPGRVSGVRVSAPRIVHTVLAKGVTME